MDIVPELGKDAIAILQYLLPGFLSAWIYYGLTPYSKPSEFERIVQALIFTLIVQALVAAFDHPMLQWFGQSATAQETIKNFSLVASVLTALAVGALFAAGANNDFFHAIARSLRITKETSYSSEWFGTLSANLTYVVLQLADERRIYGWPREWPSDPNDGHFVLQQASWLTKDGGQEPITGVECMLLNVKDVKWVEFMEKTWEDDS